jgi:pyruvate dehydrogenase E2 component (dihydrolipoamide acetyltransferase)
VALVALELPKVGLVMEDVKIVRWLKTVGDQVKLGEPLVEVETEKSVIEIEATVGGRLAEILVQIDQQAAVGDRIAWIESDQAQSIRAPAQDSAPPEPKAPPSPARVDARSGDRIRSSPVARKLAADRGLDLAAIAGSGPGGRVQLDDVRRTIGTSPSDPAPGIHAAALQVLTPMRRALARAMTLSNATVPQFMVERSVDWTTLQALRAELSARRAADEPKLSLTDFLLQAVARSLIEFPAFNATFSGDPESRDAGVVPASGAHIGLAIAVENGLLVPVLHHVERFGLAEIARRRIDCVERGLNGRLKREELDGATFSISNLGAQGPDRFTAIINPPQSAILAVGRQRDCVVASGEEIAIRPLSALTLTVDHRIADGRLAAQFLARLVEILESDDWRVQ